MGWFPYSHGKPPFHVNNSRSALSTLASIHRADILHGDIRLENILVSDSGVTIVDFSHSKQCDDPRAMDEEYARLLSLISNKWPDIGNEHLR